jgi:hypothetical protein
MCPSIRVSPEAYSGLKKMIEASYANTISAVIERFLREEGVLGPAEQNSAPNIKFDKEPSDDEGFDIIRHSSFSKSEQEEIISELGDLACNYQYQREAMRELFKKYGADNKEKIVRAYSWLDENIYVPRKSNTHKFTSKYYAEAIYNDGIKKGWLK